MASIFLSGYYKEIISLLFLSSRSIICSDFLGGQFKVPGRNDARLLLLLFVWWSLIIRTCHQSMLYSYLQSDFRKPQVITLDEMVEMVDRTDETDKSISPKANFFQSYEKLVSQILLCSGYNLNYFPFNLFHRIKLDACSYEFLDSNGLYKCFDQVAEYLNHHATFALETMVENITNSQYRSGVSSPTKLSSNLVTKCQGTF